MKSVHKNAAAAALTIALMALLALLVPASPASAYTPADAPDVKEAEDLKPVWIFHGGAEAIGDLEKFEIEDNDVRGYRKGMKEIEMVIGDQGYPSGELELSKVITFRAIQAAISQLWPEDVPAREDFEVVTSDPSPHTKGIFEYVTRAVSRDAFRLEAPAGASEKSLGPREYRYKFTNTDTEEEFETHVLEEVFPEGYFELRAKVAGGKATESEKEEFDAMWVKVRDRFLTAEDARELFYIEEEKSTAPVWPIIFTFGLFGLVAGTTVYSMARGRVREEY